LSGASGAFFGAFRRDSDAYDDAGRAFPEKESIARITRMPGGAAFRRFHSKRVPSKRETTKRASATARRDKKK